MTNGATGIMKTKQRNHTHGDRKGAVSSLGRSKTRTPDPKGRRSDASASPRKSFERYVALARDAVASGDMIESENYYQHAEHYLRLMASA